MNRIEKGLHQHYASLSGSEDLKESLPLLVRPDAEGGGQPSIRITPDLPFAKVNSIVPSSPAHEAGLKVGDKIKNFGSVHWRNHENLRRVAEVVQRNEGVRRYRTPSLSLWADAMFSYSGQFL